MILEIFQYWIVKYLMIIVLYFPKEINSQWNVWELFDLNSFTNVILTFKVLFLYEKKISYEDKITFVNIFNIKKRLLSKELHYIVIIFSFKSMNRITEKYRYILFHFEDINNRNFSIKHCSLKMIINLKKIYIVLGLILIILYCILKLITIT